MDSIVNSIVTVLLALVGVAIIATLVSNNANTSGVVTAGGNAVSNILKAATSPVTNSGGGILGMSNGAGYYS